MHRANPESREGQPAIGEPTRETLARAETCGDACAVWGRGLKSTTTEGEDKEGEEGEGKFSNATALGHRRPVEGLCAPGPTQPPNINPTLLYVMSPELEPTLRWDRAVRGMARRGGGEQRKKTAEKAMRSTLGRQHSVSRKICPCTRESPTSAAPTGADQQH